MSNLLKKSIIALSLTLSLFTSGTHANHLQEVELLQATSGLSILTCEAHFELMKTGNEMQMEEADIAMIQSSALLAERHYSEDKQRIIRDFATGMSASNMVSVLVKTRTLCNEQPSIAVGRAMLLVLSELSAAKGA